MPVVLVVTFLLILDVFYFVQNVSMPLHSDFQLFFLHTLNVCMFTLHDFLNAYNVAGGKEGSPQHQAAATAHMHTTQGRHMYCTVCLHTPAVRGIH